MKFIAFLSLLSVACLVLIHTLPTGTDASMHVQFEMQRRRQQEERQRQQRLKEEADRKRAAAAEQAMARRKSTSQLPPPPPPVDHPNASKLVSKKSASSTDITQNT